MAAPEVLGPDTSRCTAVTTLVAGLLYCLQQHGSGQEWQDVHLSSHVCQTAQAAGACRRAEHTHTHTHSNTIPYNTIQYNTRHDHAPLPATKPWGPNRKPLGSCRCPSVAPANCPQSQAGATNPHGMHSAKGGTQESRSAEHAAPHSRLQSSNTLTEGLQRCHTRSPQTCKLKKKVLRATGMNLPCGPCPRQHSHHSRPPPAPGLQYVHPFEPCQ